MKTYIIEGGVGKHIAFTSLIPALAKKKPIQVYTPYVNVFANNPHVAMAFDANTITLDDPRITQSEDIVFVEPYKSSWVKGGEHVIDGYARLLGIKKQPHTPQMFTEYLQKETDELIKKIGKPFIVVQLNGGQTTVGFNQNNPYQSNNAGRNYPYFLAQQLINELKEALPDVEILNWSLPNEPQYQGATPLDVPYTIMHELVKKSSGVIGVDSSLMHIAQAAKKTGVYIWGNTRIDQFGYADNTNLTFHQGPYILNDPRNIMVDPKQVVSLFMEKHYAG